MISTDKLVGIKKMLAEGNNEISLEDVEGQVQALSIMNANIGFLYFNVGDLKKAYESYKYAIKYCPNNDNAILGKAYMQKNNLVPKEIVKDIEEISEIADDNLVEQQ